MRITADTQVTFDAFRTVYGSGPIDMRIVIPKAEYLLVAEDGGYYYLQPVAALMEHAEAPSLDIAKEDV